MTEPDPPPIEPGRGRLVYDKKRRTIVSEEPAVTADDREQTFIDAIRAGCIAADVHLTCSYPECKCRQIPRAIATALAHSALHCAPAVPDGWQLVPKVATRDMLMSLKARAGDIAKLERDGTRHVFSIDFALVHRLLLAAAPVPPQIAEQRQEKS